MTNRWCLSVSLMYATGVFLIGFFTLVAGADTQEPASTNQLAPKSPFLFTPEVKFTANGVPRLRTIPTTAISKHKNVTNAKELLPTINQRIAKALEAADDSDAATSTTEETFTSPLELSSTSSASLSSSPTPEAANSESSAEKESTTQQEVETTTEIKPATAQEDISAKAEAIATEITSTEKSAAPSDISLTVAETAPEGKTATEVMFTQEDAATPEVTVATEVIMPKARTSSEETTTTDPTATSQVPSVAPEATSPLEVEGTPEVPVITTTTQEPSSAAEVTRTTEISTPSVASTTSESTTTPETVTVTEEESTSKVVIMLKTEIATEVETTSKVAITTETETSMEVEITSKAAIETKEEITQAVTVAPEATTAPEVITQEDTSAPEVTITQKVTIPPEVTITQKVTIPPEVTITPDVTITQEVTFTPEFTITQEVPITQEVAIAPEETIAPEVTNTHNSPTSSAAAISQAVTTPKLVITTQNSETVTESATTQAITTPKVVITTQNSDTATESESSPSTAAILNTENNHKESTSTLSTTTEETTPNKEVTIIQTSTTNSESTQNSAASFTSASAAAESSTSRIDDVTSTTETDVDAVLPDTQSTVASISRTRSTNSESTSSSPSPHLVAPPKNSDSKTNLVGHQEPSVKSRNETNDHESTDRDAITENANSEVTTSASNGLSNSNNITFNSSDVSNGTQLYLTLSKRIRLNVERMLGDQLPLGFDINKIKDQPEQELDQGINQVKNSIANSTNSSFEAAKNFATLSIEQINSYPIEAFTTVREKAIRTINSQQAKAIMERLKTTENTTLWRNMGEMLKKKVDQMYLISMIASAPSVLGSAANGMVQSLGRQLGSPATWNSSMIEGLGPSVLLLLPSEIMRIKEKETKAKILGILWNSATFRNKSEVQTNDEILLTSLIQDVYGPVEEWTTINETLSKYLPRMSPLILNKIRHEVVNNSLIVIGGVDYHDRQHAQPIIAKAMDNINFSVIALPLAQEFFHSLGKLISHLRLEDMETLPRHLLQNDGILATLARNSDIDKELARWILSLNQPISGEWRKSDVIRLHYFLQFSSGRLLQQLSGNGLLDRQTVTDILKKPDLEMGQLQAVRETSTTIYKHDGQWDIESAPAGLISLLKGSDIVKLRPEDVVNNLDKFNQIVEFLDASQKMAVSKKLVELGLRRTLRARTRAHPDFLSLIPMSDINLLKEDDQMDLLQSLSIDSPQVRNYVIDRFTDNITIASFRKKSLLAKSFTCEMLEKFRTEETMELLGALRSGSDGCPLQYKTAKCFVDKLKTYMSKLPVEIEDGDEETKLLSTLTESDLAVVGGEILIHFSADSLQDQHPPTRCHLIFSLIGQLPLSIINLVQPYEKKQQLARASINCLDKQEDIMGLSEMMTIGNLMGYLPEISIDKLGSEAFALNLPRLLGDNDVTCQQQAVTGSSNKAKIKPCLNLGMRNAIRRKLPIVFGSPFSWCETVVQSIGCLLSTLYHEQLREINDRALLASIDKLNQCWDNEHALRKGDKADVYATFCNKELLSAAITVDEAERQLKIRLKNAAFGDVGQLSRNRRLAHLTSASSKRLTCDVIRRANSAITEITLEELNTMDDLELRDCLEDVGKYPMSSAKANFLWNRIKKAYNSTAGELDAGTYHQIGYIMQSIGIEEIGSLHLNDTGLISVFGLDRNFNLDQLRALASQVKTDYQTDTSRYTPSDLLIIGNIICGFTTPDLEKIPTKYFIEVAYRLGDTISTCHPDTRKTLATLAVKGFGHPSNWTSATVTSVGSIVGGLEPNELSAIPGRSFDGLEAIYVKAIPPSSIKNLGPHQFGNFSIEAINYLTEAQLSQLNTEQLSAVNKLKSLYGRGSLVSITRWILPLLVTAALLIT